MARRTEPVSDWAQDFDVLDAGYIDDPFKVWDELRQTCPIAHTNRRGSNWLPTRYEDITAMAHDIDHFSSVEVGVIPFEGEEPEENLLPYGLPPISVDPPVHSWTRRLLLPWFSHRRVEGYEAMTRELCSSLIDSFLAGGHADAAEQYAQQIPVRVIAHILGVPADLADTFTGWVRDFLEFADDEERRMKAAEGLFMYFVAEVENRRANPGTDLLSELLRAENDGAPVEDSIIFGMAMLVLVAGVDTTWSAIGSSLWHLATNESDRKRLSAEPDLMPLAVEELLAPIRPSRWHASSPPTSSSRGVP